MEDIILSLNGVSKVYPGTVALHNVNLEIRRGETHGIIGKNGAGKTTLVGIIAGLVTPTSGTFSINGHVHEDLTRIAARRESVSIVPQEPQLVQQYTIAENLFMPDYPTRSGGAWVDWPRLYREADAILNHARLNVDSRMSVSDIGIGMQQIILMLKASYIEKSQIIILDEAFASLSELEERLFYRIIRERKADGCTILHISHRIEELLEVCDRMTVLRDGHSVRTVSRDEVDRESLAALIVGAPAVSRPETDPQYGTRVDEHSADDELLSVHNLTRIESFHDVTFSVHRNEIVGIAGMMGSGRTEIMKAIIGMRPLDAGEIRIGQHPQNINSPACALELGVVYLPEERDAEGLVDAMSVRANIVLSALKRISRGLFINRTAESELATDLAGRLAVKYASMDQEVRELSGGNRQKVVVAKVVSTRPSVYLLDEPTKGIDISARASLLSIIRSELAPDAGVVMSASGLDELMMVCDRILVLYRGRIVAQYVGPHYSEEAIYHDMQGGSAPATDSVANNALEDVHIP